jgi:hypothetical protein
MNKNLKKKKKNEKSIEISLFCYKAKKENFFLNFKINFLFL